MLLTEVVGAIWTLLYEELTSSDSYLAFLPLAHILEFAVENAFVFAGLPIGYGRVKTLTDASVRECKGDIAEFKPVRRIGLTYEERADWRRPFSSVSQLYGSSSEKVS